MTEPTEQFGITFAQLATAYGTRLLSEEAFLTLLLLVVDLPPWLSAKAGARPGQKWS